MSLSLPSSLGYHHQKTITSYKCFYIFVTWGLRPKRSLAEIDHGLNGPWLKGITAKMTTNSLSRKVNSGNPDVTLALFPKVMGCHGDKH